MRTKKSRAKKATRYHDMVGMDLVRAPANTTGNRIENLVNRIGRLVLYLVFLLFLFEGSCWIAIKAYLSLADRSRVNALAGDQAAASELAHVQSNSVFFPTRWYTNELNFRGNYVTTDQSGFRIDPMAIREQKSIGFFGGSTMFSVVTRQQDTIPAQVQIGGFNSLNFGVGGYSTAVELPTFIEAMTNFQDKEGGHGPALFSCRVRNYEAFHYSRGCHRPRLPGCSN